MTKTPHPARAAGCTPRQIEVFELIAIGDHFPDILNDVEPEVIEALVQKKLISGAPNSKCCMFVSVWEQWSRWRGENVTDDELEDADL
jgi:hypothetical protein